MTTRPRSIWGYVFLAAIALPLGTCSTFAGYAAWKVRWAQRTVTQFCGEVVIGAPVTGLDRIASERGLRTLIVPERGAQEGTFMAWEGAGFLRTFCNVAVVGGVATKKRVTSLD
jgi:hypothetical protein